MNKKRFLAAVRAIAPDDKLTLELARRVPAKILPDIPGAAALEFVLHIQQFKSRAEWLKKHGVSLPIVIRHSKRPIERYQDELAFPA